LNHPAKAGIYFQVPSFTAIVLGRGSRPEKELYIENCLQDGVAIYRRQGGGCSVVLDAGNVVFNLVLPIKGLPNVRMTFEKISDRLITALSSIGIEGIYRVDVSDLAIDNRKIVGASMYVGLDFLYYSASLLFSPNIELMERYLQHPPREPKYRAGRSHRDFVTAIKDYSEIKDIDDFKVKLRRELKYEDLSRWRG
jgi:lipoate-protein ligase A